MLIQAVHEATCGMMKVDSSEEFRPSATKLMFRASVTILISTEGINKEILWFEILEYKDIYVTLPVPQSVRTTISIKFSQSTCCFLSVASQ